ncbi:MAG: disulfide bond formation protein B [Pseudomonadota bacterium]
MSGARTWALIAALGPTVILGAALFSQYVGGLHPCTMCIWQRWPHGVAIALATLSLLIGPHLTAIWALRAGALALLIGAGIGGFHVGVEQGWWEGPSTCTGGDISQLSPEALISQIMNAPLVRCDEIAWAFLGISMAGWNAILSILMAVITWKAAAVYASSSASQ